MALDSLAPFRFVKRWLASLALFAGVLVGGPVIPVAEAWVLEVGPASQFASSAIDHSKVGLRLGFSFFEQNPWTADVRIESGLRSLTAVNPGAQSPSAPDLAESYSGDSQLFADLWLQSPWHVLPSTSLGFGMRAWLPKPGFFSLGFFPALGIRLQKERSKGHAGLSFDYSLAAATDLRLLNAEPEFAFVLALGTSSSLRLAASVSAFQNLRAPRDTFMIPRSALTWVKDF